MKKAPFLICLVLILFCGSSAVPQAVKPRYPTPPQPMDPQAAQQPGAQPRPAQTRRTIDMEKLQHDADDLARTAQTIPADVSSIRRGLLPKDTLEKLKQIEKLSKRLRSELNP